jgi:hypothetical protein
MFRNPEFNETGKIQKEIHDCLGWIENPDEVDVDTDHTNSPSESRRINYNCK